MIFRAVRQQVTWNYSEEDKWKHVSDAVRNMKENTDKAKTCLILNNDARKSLYVRII